MNPTSIIAFNAHYGPQGQPFAVRARFAGCTVESHHWTESEAQDARDAAFDAGAKCVHVAGLPTRGWAFVPASARPFPDVLD